MYWDSLVDHLLKLHSIRQGAISFSTLKVKEMISLKTS